MMDLSKLTPAPWVASHRHCMGTDADDEISGLGWDIEGPPEPLLRGTYSKAADAQFVSLAREAFDIWHKKDPEAATLWLNDTEKWYNEQARRGDVNA